MVLENLENKTKKINTQYSKIFYRYIADKISPKLKRFNISANQITISRIFFVTFGSFLILSDALVSKILTLAFFFIFSLFDALDGSLARITKKSSLGMWLDPVVDRLGLTIIFLFLGIKIYIDANIYNYLIIINFLILILYFIKYGLLSDISSKNKYLNFRDHDKKFKYTNNEVPKEFNFINTFSVSHLIENFNVKNLIVFIKHQFSPHTFNLIIYLSTINLFELYFVGLISLLCLYLTWLIKDILKITKIAINLDKLQ